MRTHMRFDGSDAVGWLWPVDDAMRAGQRDAEIVFDLGDDRLPNFGLSPRDGFVRLGTIAERVAFGETQDARDNRLRIGGDDVDRAVSKIAQGERLGVDFARRIGPFGSQQFSQRFRREDLRGAIARLHRPAVERDLPTAVDFDQRGIVPEPLHRCSRFHFLASRMGTAKNSSGPPTNRTGPNPPPSMRPTTIIAPMKVRNIPASRTNCSVQ